MANRYSVLLEFLENSNLHYNFEFEAKIKSIIVALAEGCKLKAVNSMLLASGCLDIENNKY